MKTTITITGIENWAGDTFFKVEWMDNQGTLCSDTIAEATLVELVQDINISVEFNEEDEVIAEAVEELNFDYIEISYSVDSEEEEHDVYIHEAEIKWGEIRMDFDGELVKTFKDEDKAMKWVVKQYKGITVKAY